MSDLSTAAAALGLPEALVRRSAAARAAESGLTVDEVLAAWAGGGSVEGAPAPAPEPAAEAAVEPDQAAEAPEPGAETEPVAAATAVAPTPATVTTTAPLPAEVTPAEAARLHDVITVPTAGIRERTGFAVPRWLAWVMLIIPVFALFALGGAATGTCGEATELQTDVVTGNVVNCDGSEFTGSGVGGGGSDFIAMGDAIYHGEGATCAGCHGPTGGGGVGPALNGVMTTFAACSDQLEWVRLGSAGFQEAGRSTYGDTDKPINGGMPSHGSLTDEQLAAVVSFERVRFGGGDPAVVLADCGLGPAEGEGETPGGSVPPDGSIPPNGSVPPADGGSTTTTPGA